MTSALQKLWGRIVEFGFHLLYHEFAWAYDAVSWTVSLGNWRAWQLTAVEHVRGQAILELGHGPGYLLNQLASMGYDVTGIDPSPQMAALARKRLQRAGLNAHLLQASAQSLPFEHASFDCVVATFPTAYILDPATLQSVAGVLAEDGRLVIVPSAALTGSGWPFRFIEWLYEITGQRTGAGKTSKSTDQETSGQFFKSRLQAAGFDSQVIGTDLPQSRVDIVVATRRRSA